MKKKIIGIIFGLLLVFSFTSKTEAACSNKPFLGCPSTSPNQCGNGSTCCTTPGECGQYPAPPPAGGQPAAPAANVLCGGTGISTAIGCIPILGDPTGAAFMGFVLKWAIGMGGGIAFLMILYSGFMIMSSAGDPSRLKAGQELLTSAVSGLVLLIFSVFILNFIGINILGIFS